MINKLIKLIKRGYKENPNQYPEANPIGVITVSYSDAENSYISKFIHDKKHKAAEYNYKKYLLRSIVRELIIQYEYRLQNIGVEEISYDTNLLTLEVENYIIKKLISNN